MNDPLTRMMGAIAISGAVISIDYPSPPDIPVLAVRVNETVFHFVSLSTYDAQALELKAAYMDRDKLKAELASTAAELARAIAEISQLRDALGDLDRLYRQASGWLECPKSIGGWYMPEADGLCIYCGEPDHERMTQ